MSYILFDIGGTNTRIAMSEDLQTYSKPIKYKTPVSCKEGIDVFAEHARTLLGDRPCRAIAGGIRGVLSTDKQSLTFDHVLTKWVDQPLGKMLKDKLKAPAFLENDTAIVGLGEAYYGAGQGSDILAYFTVSTGVGGVRIEHGFVDAATTGFEPGHQIVDIDRTILGEDVTPSLENLVSGAALEARTGMKPYDIPQSDAVWDQLAGYLAQGLRNTILYWSPDTIVLGGSMIVGDPRIKLDDIIRHTHDAIADRNIACPVIKDAELGDDGGLYGAMALIAQHQE